MRCTELQDLASAHAVGASTATEAARIEALAADDADLRAELASFRDAAAAVAIGQPATSSPSAAVRAAVLAQVACTPQGRPAGTGEGFLFRFRDEGGWQTTPMPGLRIRLLSTSNDLGHRTILVDLAPGASFPAHDHGGSEDLMVLSGDLVTEGRTLRAGDFLHAGPGTHHSALVSPNGCVALIVEPIPAQAPAVRYAMPA